LCRRGSEEISHLSGVDQVQIDMVAGGESTVAGTTVAVNAFLLKRVSLPMPTIDAEPEPAGGRDEELRPAA
jgi:hypothetical protein